MKLINRIKIHESELMALLTVRTTNLLHEMGITTLVQLSEADDIQLLKHPGFSRKNLSECLDVISNNIQLLDLSKNDKK
jgi:DNA-directed RNA polymerase alpha subunit